jgi:hypothetical protein
VTDKEIGDALRRAGLTPRALAAAWGTDRVAHLMAPRELPSTPATAALRLFVARVAVPAADADRGLGPLLLALVDRRLVDVDADGAAVRARIAILPVGPSLVACDRDTWPDDSSHHLVGCLPPHRVERWLDVGTGVGFAPLSVPDRAVRIVGGDVDPNSIAGAKLGVALSGITHVEPRLADLLAGVGAGYDLITFNAPIPAEACATPIDAPPFRRAPPDAHLVPRFLAGAAALLVRGGTVVVHTWLGDAIHAALDALDGDVVVARYTPDGVTPFGVVRWRPDAAPGRRDRLRELSSTRPHLRWNDLDD